MAKILLAGDICAESQYLVDKVPAVDEIGVTKEVKHLTSSKIINAGRVLALENEVTIFGVIGKDEKGKRAINDLKNYGIHTEFVYSVDQPTDEVLVITNKEGFSAIVLHISAVKYFDESKLKNLSEYEYIYTATSLPLNQLYQIIEKARKANIGIFLDVPNQQKKFNLNILRTVEFVVPNRQEVGLLLNLKISNIKEAFDAVRELKRYTDGNAIITLDRDGCVAFAKNWEEPKHFLVPKVEVIDSTGAGDIFRGVLLREFIKTKDITVSIKKALYVSSESVKIKGVSDSISYINKSQLFI